MSNQESYQSLVEAAKELVQKTDLTKLQIAQLAIRACTIRHGGRSTGFYTLTMFARDIGVSFKQLSRWVITYKTVVSKIPNEIKTNEDWNKASKISEKLRKKRVLINDINGTKGGKTQNNIDQMLSSDEILKKFKEIKGNTQALVYCDDALRRALHNLNKVEVAEADDELFLTNINRNINDFIDKAQLINERVLYLMKNIKKREVKTIRRFANV